VCVSLFLLYVFSYHYRVRVRVRDTLRLAVYLHSVRLGDKPLETHDQHFFQLNTCFHSPYVTSSLTRGWVCRSQFLLEILYDGRGPPRENLRITRTLGPPPPKAFFAYFSTTFLPSSGLVPVAESCKTGTC
jgi:hypothetical protein